jgi:allophanate hydrolase
VERGWESVTIAAGFDADDPFSRHAPGGDRHPLPSRVAVAHGVPREVVSALEGAGVETEPADIEPFLAAGRLLYDGAFVAERYSAVGAFIDAHPDEVDPIVRSIISASARLPAWQLSRDLETLALLRRTTETTWASFDALVVPTVPRIPTVAEVLADPVRTNAALGTYTNFVNLLDLCAITMPCSAPSGDAPPPSITFVAPAWHDDRLLHLARLVTPDTVATPRSA